MTHLERIINTLTGRFKSEAEREKFEQFVEYVRFPRYRNFERNTKITFDFPLTVFIGKNGSGKSSALHALFGVPGGSSTGRYWFSTPVDPIEDTEDDPHCHIHAYKQDGKMVEVLKTRINSRNYGQDYWEPSRPIAKYDMALLPGNKRHPAIKKKVVYIDFRAELSAFDQFFYFGNFQKTKTQKKRQDLLRKKSKHLKHSIDNKKALAVGPYKKRRSRTPIILTQEEIVSICHILGKKYSKCILVDHNLYDGRSDPQTTAYFLTDSLNYSEAFAGRGEFAAVKLVHKIHNAPNGSLVLLDEPEVSLHPGAQIALKEYLLEQIQKKHIQVVISTHSRHFIDGLPDCAIKLFEETDTSQVHVTNSCHPLIAFGDIGIQRKTEEKAIIHVEDTAAKSIIESIFTKLGREYEEIFRVVVCPGGAESIYRRAVLFSEEKGEKHKFLLLDRDKYHAAVPPPGQRPQGIDELTTIIEQITNVKLKNLAFPLDGGTGTEVHERKKVETLSRYLEYLHSHLDFLPGIPEQIVFDDDYIKRQPNIKDQSKLESAGDSREKIKVAAKQIFGKDDAVTIQSLINMLVVNFMEKQVGNTFESIKNTIEKFKETVENRVKNR